MKLKNTTREKFRCEVVPNKKIICWGVGKNAIKSIDEFEMSQSILFCVDSNIDKQGKKWEQWTVENPMIIDKHKDCIVFITIKEYFAVLEQIENKFGDIEVYCYELLQDFECNLENLEDTWYFERMIRTGLIRYTQNLRDEKCDEETIQKKVNELGLKLSTKTEGEFPVVLPRLVLLLTDKCTLCCEGCCAFVDRFTNPQHMDAEKLLEGVKTIFRNIDGCINVQLIGGEPFIYPEMGKVLDFLLTENKVFKIGIVTNGTVIPGDDVLSRIRNEKVFVEISDYGLLEIQAKVVNAFEKNKVNFRMFSGQEYWSDYGDPTICREKTEEELKNEYFHCFDGKKCKAFDGERLYMCYHAAKMKHLGVEWDYLHDSRSLTDGDIKKNILDCYLQRYAKACNYCAEMVKDKKQIPVGKQKDRELFKSDYTIISREELKRLRKNEERGQ